MASMKLSLFTWQWIFLRDHFFNDTDTESGLVFFKVNDTETESGLVFFKLTIPEPRPGIKPLKVRDFNETRPRLRPKMNPGLVLAPYIF